MRSNISDTMISMDKLSNSINTYRGTHTRYPKYIIMNTATEKALDDEAKKLLASLYTSIKTTVVTQSTVSTYEGIPISIYDGLSFGEIDLVG